MGILLNEFCKHLLISIWLTAFAAGHLAIGFLLRKNYQPRQELIALADFVVVGIVIMPRCETRGGIRN